MRAVGFTWKCRSIRRVAARARDDARVERDGRDRHWSRRRFFTAFPAEAAQPTTNAMARVIHVRVDHRRHVQRDELRERESADHRDAERTPRLRAGARATARSAACPSARPSSSS